MTDNSAHSATNGEPWLLTHSSVQSDFSNALDYLLPDGSRKRVFIQQAHDGETMRSNIGDALAAGRTGIVKKR